MNRIRFAILFILCSVITTCYGQTPRVELKIGDTMPDIDLGRIINYRTDKVKVSDFRGKLLILDFWATWCAPCLGFMKTTDSLRKHFGEKIDILPITSEEEAVVSGFLKHMSNSTKSLYPSIVGDTILSRMFLHNIIPHEVWIDKRGMIINITGHESVTNNTINNYLNTVLADVIPKGSATNTKVDIVTIPYLQNSPVLTGNQGIKISERELLYNSILTKYKPDLHGGASTDRESFLSLINAPLKYIYKHAFGNFQAQYVVGDRRIIFETSDSSKLIFKDENGKDVFDNFYCYELNFNGKNVGLQQMCAIMRRDVNSYFSLLGLKADVERRNVLCWQLKIIDSKRTPASQGGVTSIQPGRYYLKLQNQSLKSLTLNIYQYQQNNPYPIVDDSDFIQKVDLEINCDLSDIKAINKELEKYGLQYILAKKNLDMIIIKQIPSNTSAK
jgi:thiol-disulfide isomerase/thioredoxin